jgi:hypothetical protein
MRSTATLEQLPLVCWRMHASSSFRTLNGVDPFEWRGRQFDRRADGLLTGFPKQPKMCAIFF